MGLFDRILRVIRANLNSLISQVEDPEKILEQTVLDMQDDLIDLRQAVAHAIATQKRTEREAAQSAANAEKWQRQAQVALQKGEESLARQALIQRKTCQETAEVLQTQVEQQTAIVTQMKQNMRLLEGKLREAKAKKDMYIARARSAKASQQINQMMNRMGNNSAVSAFERMEEKVLQLEAQSEAIAELGADDLTQRIAALDATSNVDTELEAMKAQLRNSGNNYPQLPPV